MTRVEVRRPRCAPQDARQTPSRVRRFAEPAAGKRKSEAERRSALGSFARLRFDFVTSRRIEPMGANERVRLRHAERPRRRPGSSTEFRRRLAGARLFTKTMPHLELGPLDGQNALAQSFESGF